MPVCSGLSALIQAATSQLGNAVESDASAELSHPSPSHFAEGYASSSDGGDWRASNPNRTPTIVPEDARTHRSMFPELLMSVLVDLDNSDIITFLPDGKFFAVRVKELSDDLLHRHFHLSTFEEFLKLMRSWGFVTISNEEEDAPESRDPSEGAIQVFRHPHFRKGATVDLRHVRFSPSHNESNAAPPVADMRQNIERTTSDDSSINSAKRRLSPSHINRDFEDVAHKQRAIAETEMSSSFDNDHGSVASNPSGFDPSRPARRRSSTEIRSKALAVTAAQLSLDDGQPAHPGASKAERRASLPLVEGGVDKATHNIVTSAIESLLFDERHTRETFLKHEKQLSKSSLPGVVPISKQLFSPLLLESTPQGQLSRAEQVAAAARALHPASTGGLVDVSNRSSLAASPTQLEAAAALVKQAGINGAAWSGQPVTGLAPP
jgi:hypothetical protein